MSNYLKLLQTYYGGRNKSETARICGCSRGTVDTTLALAKQYGLIDLVSLRTHTEATVADLLHPAVYQRQPDRLYTMPDYEVVHRELGRPHVTLQLLWEEYVLSCRQANTRPYSETQFRRHYHRFAKDQQVTIRLKHKPGYAMQVDWAGTKLLFFDEEAGQEVTASIFVAVLPYSSLIYAEACRDERAASWLTAHVNALTYFGGSPQILVPDNLKTGVTKPDFYEPGLQQQYAELADAYGCVILPARVRKPRDKGAVENAVLIASRRIVAVLRNTRFLSIEELQQAVQKQLEQLNHSPLSGRQESRWAVFTQDEAAYLQALPAVPYEYAEWKNGLKVAPDCHVTYQKKQYSVPYEYVGKTVDLRATLRTIELFYHHERITSHKRAHGPDLYVTNPDHMPPEKTYFLNWDRDRFLRWSREPGPATTQVITAILDRAVVETQGHRACLGIVTLARKQDPALVEAACRQACHLSKEPSYRLVKHLVKELKDVKSPQAVAAKQQRGFQRGAAYFGGDRDAD